MKMSSYVGQLDFNLMILPTKRDNTSFGAGGVDHLCRSKPTGSVFVRGLLIEVNFFTCLKIYSFSWDSSSSVHGTSKSGFGGTINDILNCNFPKTMRMLDKAWLSVGSGSWLVDLVDARRDVRNAAIHGVVRRTSTKC